MLYRTTRRTTFSTHLSHYHLHFFTQTLTTLDLRWNQIGEQGAQHLANALHNNTVNHFLYSSISLPSALFHTDTHHTQPSTQSNRRARGTTSRQCFTQQHGEPLSLLIYLITICTFSHRHSPHSTSLAIKSESKGHNISPMLYTTTR